MIDLSDVTFIIPVCIESQDRLNNSVSVLSYLNYHFNTNVIIHELCIDGSKISKDQYPNLHARHIIEKQSGPAYHRTKQLN